MRSLYWLCYRVGGSFEGLVLLEADSLEDAQARAETEDLDPGGECEGHQVGARDARAIPARFIGRLLGEDEFAAVEQLLLASSPKKAPASSVRGKRAGRRSRAG
jgi:hypothetical protein